MRHSHVFLLGLSCLGAVSCKNPVSTMGSDTLVWKISKPAWDAEAEKQFSAWVNHFATVRATGACESFIDCVRNPKVNSLYDDRDASLNAYADCADFPMQMRTYFSFKKGLPFALADVSGDRYTAGNHTTGRNSRQESFKTMNSLFTWVTNQVASGFYRTSPEDEGTDTYPIDVRIDSVKPGTIFYDPNGHVLMVYQVDPTGAIHMMDGNTEGKTGIKIFSEAIERGTGSQGGGFRNWRKTSVSPKGDYIRSKNAEHSDFSVTAQYQSTFDLGGGVTGTYYQWVKSRLATVKSNPIEEFDTDVKQICSYVSVRLGSVDGAIKAGINNQPHPDSLPPNIFGATGDWESYATASRDVIVRGYYRSLNSFIKYSTHNVQKYEYSGSPQQLLAEYQQHWANLNATSECQFTYKGSDGSPHVLTLNDLNDRLYDISFDPYFCPELRWGSQPGRADWNERACNQGNKMDWYARESSLRNIVEREPGANTPLGSGPQTQMDLSVQKLLSSGL